MENCQENREGDEEILKRKALARVEAKVGFYGHLLWYVLISSLLLLINSATYSGEWWFVWPVGGWGIAMAIHFFTVFVSGAFLEDLKNHMFERELRRLRRHSSSEQW